MLNSIITIVLKEGGVLWTKLKSANSFQNVVRKKR